MRPYVKSKIKQKGWRHGSSGKYLSSKYEAWFQPLVLQEKYAIIAGPRVVFVR
jgi:hypothetical protein